MYCVRCRKEIAKSDPRMWAVLPGRNRPVPTCYDDRLCEASKVTTVIPPAIVKPLIVFISHRPPFNKIRNKIHGCDKYLRRYKFRGREINCK